MDAAKLCALLVLLANACAIEARLAEGFHVIKHRQVTTGCTVPKYVPGGGPVLVNAITPKKASMTSDFLSALAGKGEAISGVAANYIGFAEANFNKFANTAGKLAANLGVFGMAAGFIGGLAGSSEDGLLDAVNKAVNGLTDDVNDRLEKMKGYVNHQIIDLEKDLLTREYKHMSNLFSNCIRELEEVEVNRCMRDANSYSRAGIDKMAVFHDEIDGWTDEKPPSHMRIRRIEVNLISFRDYVTLRILILETLIQTYKITKSEPALAGRYATQYTEELKSDVAKFIHYVEKAWVWIRTGHKGWFAKENCMKSTVCNDRVLIYEGSIVPVPTYQNFKCFCYMDAMSHKAESDQCGANVLIRYDGLSDIEGSQTFFMKTKDIKSVAKAYWQERIKNNYGVPFARKFALGIQFYWQGEVLDLVKKWKLFL